MMENVTSMSEKKKSRRSMKRAHQQEQPVAQACGTVRAWVFRSLWPRVCVPFFGTRIETGRRETAVEGDKEETESLSF